MSSAVCEYVAPPGPRGLPPPPPPPPPPGLLMTGCRRQTANGGAAAMRPDPNGTSCALLSAWMPFAWVRWQ